MAFVNGKIELNFYNDPSETSYPEVNIPKITRIFEDLSASEVQSTVITIAAAGSQTINLNGVNAVNMLYIFSGTEDVNVNINGLGNILFTGNIPGLVPANVTSLVITNTSASASTVVEVILLSV